MGGLLLALATASCAASAFAQSAAQPPSLDPGQRALLNDIFTSKPKTARQHRAALTTTTLGLRENPQSAEATVAQKTPFAAAFFAEMVSSAT